LIQKVNNLAKLETATCKLHAPHRSEEEGCSADRLNFAERDLCIESYVRHIQSSVLATRFACVRAKLTYVAKAAGARAHLISGRSSGHGRGCFHARRRRATTVTPNRQHPLESETGIDPVVQHNRKKSNETQTASFCCPQILRPQFLSSSEIRHHSFQDLALDRIKIGNRMHVAFKLLAPTYFNRA
jgi:hypothetical protein